MQKSEDAEMQDFNPDPIAKEIELPNEARLNDLK